MSIEVTIPGVPVAQGRPRATVVGGHARVYSPRPAADWRGRAQVLMHEQAPDGPPGLPCWPLELDVLAIWPQPTSAPKRDRCWRRWRPSRPDGDNVLKAVQDAGNGVLWHDDAQIVSATVRKVVGRYGEPPRVVVTVRPALPVEDETAA